MTTRRGTYPRGTYRFRPRRLVKRKRTVKRTVRRSSKLHTRKRPASMRQYVDTKRRRTWRDPNQYRQLETLVSRHGRKMSSARFIQRLVTSSYDYAKFIFRGYLREDGPGLGGGGTGDTGGRYYPCGYQRVSASVNRYPVYMFNITTLPQFISGAYQNVTCGYRLQSDPTVSTNGSVSWQICDSMNNAGSNLGQSFWQTYSGEPQAVLGTTTAGSFPKALMEYVNLKFTLRGARARPTRFIVQIIQPYKWFTALPDETGYDQTQNAVWMSMANRLCANMCQNVPSDVRKPWRVLFNRVYEVQPTSTTELDVGGHDIHQRHFWKCNRSLNYRSEGGYAPDNGEFGDLNIGDMMNGKRMSCLPAIGTRLYVLVQAYNPNSSVAFNADVHPSFDLSMEKKVSNLGVV